MKRINLPAVLFVLVVIVATAVRALSLSVVFDSSSGLAASDHYLTWIFHGLTVLVFVYALMVKSIAVGSGRGGNPLLLVSALMLGASGIMDVIEIIRDKATLIQTAFAIFSIASAICVLLLSTSRNAEKMTLGFFATIPIFYGIFWFLTLHAKNQANPVVLSYFNDFMAVLFFSIAASTFAGIYFGIKKTRLLSFVWVMGVFFTFVCAVSPFAAKIIDPYSVSLNAANIADYMRMTFALIYIVSLQPMTNKALEMPDKESEDTENAEDSTV
ncbi:MAG: hypothetical protein FWG36_05280 [Oscillospiraceae bacterium]|nr:hypothetical protein [Oscillospiraceae bacterium]